MKEQIKKSVGLFLYFFKTGWFTFGGGWSIVAQMQKDYVDKKAELSNEELLDIVSVGRSLPGTMIGNVAYIFGYRQAGICGGVMSVIGISLPPLAILSVLTLCYVEFKDNALVAKALTGVRAVVAPIIYSAVAKMQSTAFPKAICYILALLGAGLYLLLDISCVWLVLLGAAAGFGVGAYERRKLL